MQISNFLIVQELKTIGYEVENIVFTDIKTYKETILKTIHMIRENNGI